MRESVTVGRHPANDFSFPDDSGLSRQHLAMRRQAGAWILEDLGSKNGTFLNGSRVTTPTSLSPGDKIVASAVTIACEDGGGPLRTVVFESPSASLSANPKYALSLKEAIPSDASGIVNALIRAGKELAVRRPLPELFRIMLEQSMEAVRADRGVLLTLEDGHLVEQASRGDSFRISTMVRDRVLNERQSLLIQNVLSEEILHRRDSIVFAGVQSLMAAPLQTDERVIGLLYVDSVRLITPFTQESLSLLTVMANVVAVRLEQERMAIIAEQERFHAMEIEQAAEIQRSHLPASPPSVPGLELAGHQSPSSAIGGDYYDFLSLAGNRIGLVVGDVAGKGLPASLLMMKMQAHVQALSELDLEPVEFVRRFNRAIVATCPANRFITFCFVEVDPAARQLHYCNAGHNPPFILHADGGVTRLTEGGAVVGLLPKVDYRSERLPLRPGDLLAMYSDGITEAENPENEEFGETRLMEVLRKWRHAPTPEIIAAVNRAVNEWTGAAPPSDDRTLLLMKVLE